MAEMLKHGKSEIPGIGSVEFAWVAGPPPPSSSSSDVATTMNGSHARNRSEGDVEMGDVGGGSEDGRVGADGNGVDGEVDGGDGGKELGQSHDVEYDVAEDHDWGIE